MVYGAYVAHTSRRSLQLCNTYLVTQHNTAWLGLVPQWTPNFRDSNRIPHTHCYGGEGGGGGRTYDSGLGRMRGGAGGVIKT